MTIKWVKEITPTINMIKEKIALEKSEIELCKSWMWNNERIVEWLKDIRSFLNEDNSWDITGLPKLEVLYPELFIKNVITDKDIIRSCKTYATTTSALSLNCEYTRPPFQNHYS